VTVCGVTVSFNNESRLFFNTDVVFLNAFTSSA